jgi:hypothetical protein
MDGKDRTAAYRMMSEVFCTNRSIVECASKTSECLTGGELDPLQSDTGDSFMGTFMGTFDSPITTTKAPHTSGLQSMLCLCDCPMLTNFVTEIMAPSLTSNEIWTRYLCPVVDDIPTCVSQHDSCLGYRSRMFSERMIAKMKAKCTAYATKCTDEWMSVRIANCTATSIVSTWELGMMSSCSSEAIDGSLNSSENKEACCSAAQGLTTCLSDCILDITAVSHSGYNNNCADSMATDAAFLQVCPNSGIPSQEDVVTRIEVTGLPHCTALTVDEREKILESRLNKLRDRDRNASKGDGDTTSEVPTTTASVTSTVTTTSDRNVNDSDRVAAVVTGAQIDSEGTGNSSTGSESKVGKGSALIVGIAMASDSDGSEDPSKLDTPGGLESNLDSVSSDDQDPGGCADLFIEGQAWYAMWSKECKSGCDRSLTCAAGCSTCYIAADDVCMSCTNSGSVMDQAMCEDHFPQGEWCNITARVAVSSASRQERVSQLSFAMILALLVWMQT